MSEKQQRTAAYLREKMLNRYGDECHTHNKYHLSYYNSRTYHAHPSLRYDEHNEKNASTGHVRKFKLRKIRKRLDKGRIH